MTAVNNFLAANFVLSISFLNSGVTCVGLGVRFHKSLYFDYLKQYKPGCAFLYPFLATWFIRSSEIESANLDFLKCVIVTGSVLDIASANLFATKLPHVTLNTINLCNSNFFLILLTIVYSQHYIVSCLSDSEAYSRQIFHKQNIIYGSSECLLITATNNSPKITPLFEINGKKMLTTGKPIGNVQVKIVDLETRVKRGPGERGEILVKTPGFMGGYFTPGASLFCSQIDEEGWFQTGDIGFFDSDGNLYVIERISFLFKYYMSFVSPVELESVLQEHEAVEAAGVVGVPNPETTNLARAFVVLRPGYHVSADELKPGKTSTWWHPLCHRSAAESWRQTGSSQVERL
ncbi:hypothetical protein B566_EDAN002161 [Ephemera danica]|nr:hypothetical protein B566_EDAN002161 [Ephemera danica]